MSRSALRSILLITLLLLGASTAIADWSVVENPVTGKAEAVWSNPEGETSADVLYSQLDDDAWAPSTTLSDSGKAESKPVLLFDDSGGRSAIWDTLTATILMRTQPPEGGSWSDELILSETGEVASRPAAFLLSGDTYVIYETSPPTGSRLVKVTKIDSEGNVERSLLAATTYSSPLNTEIHSDGILLWVDWIDSSSALGYSVLIDGVWESPSYEPYGGPTDVLYGRGRIRSILTGG